MTTVPWSGLYTALVTPFASDGAWNPLALETLIEEQIAAAVDGIVILGTTGECPTVSHSEHKTIIQHAAKAIGKRTKLIAGTGSNSTAEAIELSVSAQESGADALLLVNPYYNKPTQSGMYEHFAAIIERTKIPIILYNIMGRCGVNLETTTLEQLVRQYPERVVGVKEASGNINQVMEVRAALPRPFAILSGDDNLTLPIMTAGGDGVVSVLSNAFPRAMKRLVHEISAENLAAAQALHYQLMPLMKACFLESNPIPIKTMLELLGGAPAHFRLPMVPLSAEPRVAIQNLLQEYQSKVG